MMQQIVWFLIGEGVEQSSTVTSRPTMSPDCACGCQLNQSSGHIVVSPVTDCPTSDRVWLIRTSDGLRVQLTVHRFNAKHGSVRVRDGNSSLSNLLLQLDGGSTAEVLPRRPFTSTASTMRVEHLLPADQSLDVNTCDFVASFRAVSKYSPTLPRTFLVESTVNERDKRV